MFLLPGHGSTAVERSAMDDYAGEKVYAADAACGFTDAASYYNIDMGSNAGRFGYYFEDAAGLDEEGDLTKALDDLADAMVLDKNETDNNSGIPPVFTYFGQFVDHDITANTDSETGLSKIDTKEVTALKRKDVTASLMNLRAGALNLDSLHGGGPIVGDFAKKLIEAMRYRADRAKLWGGKVVDSDRGDQRPPQGGIRDVLRLDRLLRAGVVTEKEIMALPDDIRATFVIKDEATGKEAPRRQRAIIGDMRNDENLVVSQFHMAMQRMHNAIVQRRYEAKSEHEDAPRGDTDELFDWARARTTWIYQWLIVHQYLPAICDPDTLAAVMKDGPVLYEEFFEKNPPSKPELMPLPLEFSVAAFRFGHTMVREAYDWNAFFDLEKGTEASFDLLFAFTGNGKNPMFGANRLPSNWPIDWDRFVHPVTDKHPDRAARTVDSRLALPLGDMANEEDGKHGVLRHLARRNLRRGLRLNVPHAQAIIDALAPKGISIQKLSPHELKKGATGKAVADGKFEEATPLWFYILKEAEEICGGACLGPLGSRLVADTLVGLIKCDPNSYWNATDQGKNWKPEDSVKPGGVSITTMADMMRAAGTL